MASILRVNTLTDASSNNSVATSVLFNGSAKAWNNVTQGTSAIQDSYNISSISDDGTGEYTQNYSNNMTNALYAISGTAQNAGCITTITVSSNLTKLRTILTSSAGVNDYDDACNSIHGDLA